MNPAETLNQIAAERRALDAIADKVLAYRPKPTTKAAKKRKRRATKIAKAKGGVRVGASAPWGAEMTPLLIPAEFGSHWVEEIMNETVRGIYSPRLLNVPEPCWYFVGEGVTVWRESDGHSPVEPFVPGD
jgi:hypothetical protein